MAIENIADLLKSLGHKGAARSTEMDAIKASIAENFPGVTVQVEDQVLVTPAKPPRSTQTAQTPTMKAAKTKKQSAWAKLEASYKRYDPAKEGYGSADEWRGTFYVRMGWEKAMKLLEGRSPRTVLGVMANATFEECRSAFKKLCKEWHPDRVVLEKKEPVQAAEKLQQIYAAYEVLEHENGK